MYVLVHGGWKRHARLAACAVLLAALSGCLQHASAATVAECTAASGVLIDAATGVPPVCYPKFFWPWWNWGCSWHSCPAGYTCVPTATYPYYTCVPLPTIPSPCSCSKNIKYCANQSPPAYCAGETWQVIPDCTTPASKFCTRREIAMPRCVPLTCALYKELGINPCPQKCYRCVDTKFGPKCVRICKWPCTWCPHGTFCVDHNYYGAMCIPWPWWQWQAVDATRAVKVLDTAVTCEMLDCPTKDCVMTDSGPQCGGACTTIDKCKISPTAPAEPAKLQAVANPVCRGVCTPAVKPKLEAPPANSCVTMPQPCPDGTVCKEPESDAGKPECVTVKF